MPTSGERQSRPFPKRGEGRCSGSPPLPIPMPTPLRPGVMAAARVSSGLSPSWVEQETSRPPTGNEAFASAFFPCKPRATETAPPGLRYQKVKRADPSCGQAERLGRQAGSPPYLHAVQLLGQDAEKVIGEVAQQWWVPVSIAPLAGRGCGV